MATLFCYIVWCYFEAYSSVVCNCQMANGCRHFLDFPSLLSVLIKNSLILPSHHHMLWIPAHHRSPLLNFSSFSVFFLNWMEDKTVCHTLGIASSMPQREQQLPLILQPYSSQHRPMHRLSPIQCHYSLWGSL